MTKKELKRFNKTLLEKYGRSHLDQSRAEWRLVPADIMESRFGEFNEWYGDIFLRVFNGIKETFKYDWLDIRQFVFEKLVYVPCWELMGKDLKIDYEAVYAWPPKRLASQPSLTSVEFLTKVADRLIGTMLEGTATYHKGAAEKLMLMKQMRKDHQYDQYAENLFYDSEKGQFKPWGGDKKNKSVNIVLARG